MKYLYEVLFVPDLRPLDNRDVLESYNDTYSSHGELQNKQQGQLFVYSLIML